MDIFQSQQEEKHPQKFRSKRRLNEDQVRLLERSFTTNKKLDTELKQKLANQLGVPPRQVAIWYQNKRARWKTQSLELDYNTNQVKLQIALADKRRLEKDVKQLREELRQTQEVLFALSNQKAMETNSTTVVSCNSYSTATTCCSDQNGYCSIFNFLHEDYNSVHRNHDDQPLQIDHELYACLIGGGDGGGGGGGSAWS